MTKKNYSKTNLNEISINNNNELKIYDKFSHEFGKNIAKIRTQITEQDNMKKMRINIYQKFRKLTSVEFEITNETLSLDYMLSRLQTEANSLRIYRAEWPKNYLFFIICTIQKLKDYGMRILKTFEIILTEPIETITDESDKQKLMELYHNDPIGGGHCGQKNFMQR